MYGSHLGWKYGILIKTACYALSSPVKGFWSASKESRPYCTIQKLTVLPAMRLVTMNMARLTENRLHRFNHIVKSKHHVMWTIRWYVKNQKHVTSEDGYEYCIRIWKKTTFKTPSRFNKFSWSRSFIHDSNTTGFLDYYFDLQHVELFTNRLLILIWIYWRWRMRVVVIGHCLKHSSWSLIHFPHKWRNIHHVYPQNSRIFVKINTGILRHLCLDY